MIAIGIIVVCVLFAPAFVSPARLFWRDMRGGQ